MYTYLYDGFTLVRDKIACDVLMKAVLMKARALFTNDFEKYTEKED